MEPIFGLYLKLFLPFTLYFMTIRSFIALIPDADSRRELAILSKSIKALHGFDGLRFLDPFQFHLTLAFLGNQEGNVLKDITESIDECLNRHRVPISIPLTSVIYFPEGKQPKVLAAMSGQNNDLNSLQQAIISEIPHANPHFGKIKRQAKHFTPHISLARINRHTVISIPINLTVETSVKFSELAVMKSTLSTNGPVYEPIYRWQTTR